MKKRNVLWVAILGIIVILTPFVLAVLLKGLVLTYLWEWFVTPVFGIRTLGIAEALGLSIIVSYLTHQTQSKDKDADTKIINLTFFMQPLAALAVGWIITLFM